MQSARVRYEAPLGSSNLEFSSLAPDEPLRESLTTALQLVLERLPPKERLVFLLREVFDYEYEEIAKIIRKNASNCRQMLRRARKHLTSGRTRFIVKAEQLESLNRHFVRTCTSGDVQGLVALLSSS